MKKLFFLLIFIIFLGLLSFVVNYSEPEKNESEKQDLIKVSNPRPNQAIESPLFVQGEARGFWFFEASFPIKLFDENNFLLGIKPAQTLSEWMTEDFVPFEATFPFAVPSTLKGEFVLEKDNPSGLPENADELIIPVSFKEITKPNFRINDSKYIFK